MNTGINLSLEHLLGRLAEPYARQVILPEIAALAQDGKISDHELRKIADAVEARGFGVLLPPITLLGDATKNTLEKDGWIGEAVLRLTDAVSIRHFIKRTSDREDYHRAVRLQQAAHDALAITPYHASVPAVRFANKKERVIITPSVDGMTLKDALDTHPEEKEAILRRVITDYVSVFTHLNEPSVRTQLSFPDAVRDFTEMFRNYYLSEISLQGETALLLQAFARDIGTSLTAARGSIVHGDLHAKNTLVNGTSVFLDWPNAAANGFPELDIGKLLTKAHLPLDLEKRLARHAAEQLYTTPEEQEASFVRYTHNQIFQDLITAKRYLFRAAQAETADDVDRLQKMATISYNTALRRAHDAAAQGIITTSFVEHLTQVPAQHRGYSTPILSDEAYEALKKTHNPHLLMSQENVETSPSSLAQLVAESQPGESINRIRTQLDNARWRKRGKVASIVGGILFGLAALVSSTLDSINARMDAAQQKQEVGEERIGRSHQWIYTHAYDRVMRKIIDEKITNTFTLDDPIVQEIAQKHGLDYIMIRRMIQVSRCYGSGETSQNPTLRNTGNVNILDPFRITLSYHYTSGHPGERTGTEILDPVANLDAGAARVAGLIKKHNGNVAEALIDYHTPSSEVGFFPFDVPQHHTNQIVRSIARKLAYNTLHGLASAMDGGIYSVWLQDPPADFCTPKLVITESKPIKYSPMIGDFTNGIPKYQ